MRKRRASTEATPEDSGQAFDRRVCDERHRVRDPCTTRAIAANDAHLATQEGPECGGGCPFNDVADARPAVDGRFNGSAEADLIVDDRAPRERESQTRGPWVGPRLDLDHRWRNELVDEAAIRAVNDVEAPVLYRQPGLTRLRP